MNFIVKEDTGETVECWLNKGEEGIVEFHVGGYIVAGLNQDGILELYNGIYEHNTDGIVVDTNNWHVAINRVPFCERFNT